MSFCRIEDGVSDINCYESGDGRVDIIVRKNVSNPNYSIPEGLNALQEMEFSIKHFNKLYLPWDNHHAGEKFTDILPVQAVDILEAMVVDGVLVPDNVIPDLWKMVDVEFEPSIADFREAPTI